MQFIRLPDTLQHTVTLILPKHRSVLHQSFDVETFSLLKLLSEFYFSFLIMGKLYVRSVCSRITPTVIYDATLMRNKIVYLLAMRSNTQFDLLQNFRKDFVINHFVLQIVQFCTAPHFPLFYPTSHNFLITLQTS